MPNTVTPSIEGANPSPDFLGLVRFLLRPFLDEPQSLSIDCERIESTQKIWIRVAFDAVDKGKIFGRGGRNLQAIRTVLDTAASSIGKSLHLEVYGSHEGKSERDSESSGDRSRYRERNAERRPPRRNNDSRPQRKENF
jgi:uncharacterized protein